MARGLVHWVIRDGQSARLGDLRVGELPLNAWPTTVNVEVYVQEYTSHRVVGTGILLSCILA